MESDKVPELINRRFVWGGFALWLGILPLVFGIVLWPFFVLSGPAAVFVGLWGWKRPGSVVQGRRRVAAIFGVITGMIQITIILVAAIAVWKGASRG